MKNLLTNEVKGRKLVTSGAVFIITILVTILTILGIWLFGLGQHRTIFENSLLSTSILSIAFFLFISIGLYRGIKLKDDIGKLTDKNGIDNFTFLSEIPFLIGRVAVELIAESIEGIVIGLILWIIVTVVIIAFVLLFGIFFWPAIIAFIAMLYWIFFRALRLVFKNSNKCKADLVKSMAYGIAYTVFYNFWIYGIILTAHYLGN